ncbi:MAG: indole-3-glycerol phosphate synthase TrpC, partial [Gammaproteobacteria bacterium]
MLDQIIKTKKDRINILKEHYLINDHLDSKPTKFFQTLLESSNVYKIIGEIKKASPSAGIIKEDFDLLSLANKYISSGISNLSVLTEEDYFLGQYEYISQIKETLDIKILQKDFIIDEWQIYHAKSLGADCILLISEALTKVELNLFIKIAKEQGLDVLLEFHNEDEITKIA